MITNLWFTYYSYLSNVFYYDPEPYEMKQVQNFSFTELILLCRFVLANLNVSD